MSPLQLCEMNTLIGPTKLSDFLVEVRQVYSTYTRYYHQFLRSKNYKENPLCIGLEQPTYFAPQIKL